MRKPAIILSLFLASCSTASAVSSPDPTQTPTDRPTATATATASQTPTPSNTPTETPRPTATENALGIDWAVDCEDGEPLTGYWFHTDCLPGIVSENFWLSNSPSHYVGAATFYSEGLMEKVAANRGLSLVNKWGGVAVMFCGDVGRTVYLRPFPEGRWQGPYLVVDCSAREHLYYNIMVNQIALEVDFQTWHRWRADGPLFGVHVCFTHPNCGAAYSLTTWFERNVEWEKPD